MHFSLLTKIGNSKITTALLTGKSTTELSSLPTHSETGSMLGEFYNEHQEEGDCTEYYLSNNLNESVVISEIDTNSDEEYMQVTINTPDTGQIVTDERLITIYDNLIKHMAEFDCPQYEDLDDVRNILSAELD